MNDDLKELLESLKSREVEFLIIGAHAVAFYGRPRFTEDLDLWVGRSGINVERLKLALEQFGAPIGEEGARRFSELDRQMVRIGSPPNMADVLNFAGDVPFEDAWLRRVKGALEGIEAHFPSREDLIEMKKAAGRPQDLADIERLREMS